MSKKAVAFLATKKAEASRRFYQEVVGLTFVEESDFAVVFDVAGTMLRIQKVEAVSVAPYTSFGFEVDDIEAEVDRLVAKGVEGKKYPYFEQDRRGIWASPGGAKVFWFEDPDGNLISLSQFG